MGKTFCKMSFYCLLWVCHLIYSKFAKIKSGWAKEFIPKPVASWCDDVPELCFKPIFSYIMTHSPVLTDFNVFLHWQAMATKISYILVLSLAALTTASIYNAPTNRKLEQLRKLTDIIHEKLITENCLNEEKNKRNLMETSSDGVQLEAQSELYQHLVDLLIACRKAKQETTTTPITTTKTMTETTETSTTAPTTTPKTTTTTSAPLPVECVNAINLTESWRKDHNGSNINGGSNCDTRDMINSGRPWFRISGNAGSKLLNRCPPKDSCGTEAALWSDSTMPSAIGVVTSVTAQGSYGNCNQYPRQVSVMRCSSAPSDFVYRYDDSSEACNIGFCGMDWVYWNCYMFCNHCISRMKWIISNTWPFYVISLFLWKS